MSGAGRLGPRGRAVIDCPGRAGISNFMEHVPVGMVISEASLLFGRVDVVQFGFQEKRLLSLGRGGLI